MRSDVLYIHLFGYSLFMVICGSDYMVFVRVSMESVKKKVSRSEFCNSYSK